MHEITAKAYAQHGEVMRENLLERADLMRFYGNPKYRDAELQLIEDERLDSNEHGILRFFKYHMFTHETRPYILKAYDMDDTMLPFCLHPKQVEAVQTICEHINEGRDILIDKSRDEGLSWLFTVIALWYWRKRKAGNDIIFGSRKFEYVDKKGAMDTLFEKFRYNLYMLEDWMLPANFEANKHDNVGFITNPETGNYLRGEANNPNFGSSGRYLFGLMDEFSKWEETDDQAWTSMGQSSPCRVALSTPWGMGRKYSKLRFGGTIDVFEIGWEHHPIKGAGLYKGDDPYLPERKDANLSPWYVEEEQRLADDPQANIDQELNRAHLSSGHPFFDNYKVQSLYTELEKNPPDMKRYEFTLRANDEEEYIDLFESIKGRVWVHKEPEKGWKFRYCIPADVAEGKDHGDNSVFYVYDRVEGIDVAGFCGKCDPRVFALLLIHFGLWYDDAYVAPENNSMGSAVIHKMKELYFNIYTAQVFDKFVDYDTVTLGHNTNKKTRGIMLDNFKSAINDNCHGVKELEVWSECLTFININGKPQAEPGCWDDRVMAQGIKWILHDWLPAPYKMEESYNPYAHLKPFGGGRERQTGKKDIRRFW